MAITRTPMVDDDGSGTTGTIINAAWKTELYDQIDGIGTWSNIPFLASNFPGQPGITAGMVQVNRFAVIGKTLFWIMQQAAAPGNGATKMNWVIPGGFSADGVHNSPLAHAYDGAYVIGYVTRETATLTAALKQTGANWTAGGSGIYLHVTMTIPIL